MRFNITRHRAAKNPIVEKALRSVVEPMGHEVFNYGMYSAEDKEQLTYVQVGILTAVLLNSGAADYVITGSPHARHSPEASRPYG